MAARILTSVVQTQVFPQIGQFEAKLALINFVLRLKLKGGHSSRVA